MKLDWKKTAAVSLDFQQGILAMATGADTAAMIANAAKILEHARKKQGLVVHVGLGFSEGHPEIPDFDSPLLRAKQNNLFVKGSPTAEFHESIIKPGELIVYKQRIGAFSQNHLQLLLRARGVENLILFGIATSGIVLSTLRHAFDLDFRCTVVKDACFDTDPEVHRVLTEKIFTRQASVLNADAFIGEQG